MLIDDDEATNFFNEMVIKQSGMVENVTCLQSGQEGLDYLTSDNKDANPTPDLIFLDINMPGMNGWEFLDNYKLIHAEHQSKQIIIMLTTSLNPEDEKRASNIEEITTYKHKPLSKEVIEEIIEKYFSNM